VDLADGVTNNEAQKREDAGTLEQVSNAWILSNDQTGNLALGDNSNEIPVDHSVGLSLATEVTAYMCIWAKQGDPDLFGDWDYEVIPSCPHLG
jgi:hypothetical protein